MVGVGNHYITTNVKNMDLHVPQIKTIQAPPQRQVLFKLVCAWGQYEIECVLSIKIMNLLYYLIIKWKKADLYITFTMKRSAWNPLD